MKTTKLFALVLALFLLALPLTSCTLGADEGLSARLDSMEALLAEQNATIEGLNAKLTEQSSTIAGQNTIINGLNTQLFEQNTTIGNLNSKLTEQNTIIAGQNTTIEGLNAQLTEQNNTITNLNTELSEQNATINDLNTQIAVQDSKISNLKSKVDNLPQSPNNKYILLTKDNYKDYIAFNITYSDFRVQETPDHVFGQYCFMCNMTITTYAKQPNISFENVSINYSILIDIPDGEDVSLNDWWFTVSNQDRYDQSTDLSFEGYSQSTFHFFNYSDDSEPWYLNTHQSILDINSITGYVVITE